MKLSTRGRYGIQAMFDLAMYGREEPQAIKEISQRQEIPEAYLEQLIAILRKNELVKSVRGAQGGYMITRAPEEIRVGDVLRALEGDLSIVSCTVEGVCAKAAQCPSQAVWKRMSDGLNAVVDSITLQTMIDDYKKMNAQGDE